MFDTLLHLGTLSAVAVVFRRELAAIFRKESRPLLVSIVLATIPTGIIGLLFKDFFESAFRNPRLVSFMLLVTGALVFSTRFTRPGTAPVTPLRALAVGIAQGLAIIPGISRSGATITCALWAGMSREAAGAFSFLISVPAILGAAFLNGMDVVKEPPAGFDWTGAATGTLISFAVGIVALRWLMGFIRGGKLHYFTYYCFAAGAAGLWLAG